MDDLMVRRELSEDFCYYSTYYDSFDDLPNRAKKY